VTVTPSQRRLIGIDILRQLGTFRLGDKALTAGKVDGDTCNEPMLVASDLWGNQLHLVAALSIDGQLRTTLLDSGANSWLSGDRSTIDQLHTRHASRVTIRDMGPRQHAARVSEATADVEISGQPFTVTFKVYKDAGLPWHYILGSGALQFMDFHVDFDTRHTCLLLHDRPR